MSLTKYIFLFSLLFCSSFFITAQNQLTVDSLLQVLEANITAKKRVDVYVNMAREYIFVDSVKLFEYTSEALQLADSIGYVTAKVDVLLLFGRQKSYFDQYAEALEYYNRALMLSTQENYFLGEANAYGGLEAVYYNKGNLSFSIEYGMSMLEVFKKIEDKDGVVRSYISLGTTLCEQGQYKKSLEYLFLALHVIGESKVNLQTVKVNSSLGIVCWHLGDYELALKYYKLALKASEALEDVASRPSIIINIGLAYEAQGKYQKAMESYKKGMKVASEYNNSFYIGIAYNSLGAIYAKQGLNEKALEYKFKSLEIFEEIGTVANKTTSLIAIGIIYIKLNRLDQSRVYLKRALQISNDIGLKVNAKNAAEQLSLLENKSGNYKLSYDYLLLFKEISDSLVNKEKIEAVAQMRADYTYKTEKDSILFANDKEKLILNQLIQNQQTGQYATIATILVLSIMVFILYRYYQSKQKANRLLKEQNEQILLQKKELESLDEAKSRFFANVSHELRTPLTLISAPLFGLANRSLSEEAMQELNFVKNNTENLKSLVDDILDLSRLESQKLEVETNNVELLKFLNRVVGNFSSMAEYLEITYELDIDFQPDEYLRTDIGKLEKIINNLLSNALKHTSGGGTIQLTAQKQEDFLCLKVTDSGTGISYEDIPYIFDRYFQSKQPEAPLQGGTGIGLALALEYTRLMGGTLTVESELEKGSVFELILPYVVGEKTPFSDTDIKVSKTLEPTQEEDTTILREKEADYTVLVVDDHIEMQQFIKSILQTKYEVVTAFHGKQALEQLSKESVDLMVSDVMMPEMDGFSLLRTLRADERYVGLPVLMLTALTDEKNKLEALSIGVDDYLAKPFSQNELLVRIANMLQRYEARKSVMNEGHGRGNSGNLLEDTEKSGKGVITFIEQVEQLIIAEMENEKFLLDDFAEAFHIGKHQFRRRVKSITGLSPKEYQREVALLKARQLLENDVYGNLTAVAYSVGIRNPTRFADYYLNRFGKDPREYFSEYL